MNSLTITQVTPDDIRAVVDAALTDFFSSYSIQPKPETTDIGKGAEFASRITGKAVPTIYDLVHKRLIPHSKCGGNLYFKKSELLEWLQSGRRRTQAEIAGEAETFSPEKSRQ